MIRHCAQRGGRLQRHVLIISYLGRLGLQLGRPFISALKAPIAPRTCQQYWFRTILAASAAACEQREERLFVHREIFPEESELYAHAYVMP